jgi:hypothetical protein
MDESIEREWVREGGNGDEGSLDWKSPPTGSLGIPY